MIQKTDGTRNNTKTAEKLIYTEVNDTSDEWTKRSDKKNHEMKQEKKTKHYDTKNDDISDEELKQTLLRGEV